MDMADSRITIQGKITGRDEGASRTFLLKLTNSSGIGVSVETTATTGLTVATALAPPSTKALFLLVSPPSSNESPLRFSGSTAEVGIPLSSSDPSVFSIKQTTYYLYTTAASAVAGIRLNWF